MRYRLLGTSGLRVSELFLGAMTFSDDPGGVDRHEARRIVDAYAAAGGNVIDTAINYGDGASEEIVGELMAREKNDDWWADAVRKPSEAAIARSACAGALAFARSSSGDVLLNCQGQFEAGRCPPVLFSRALMQGRRDSFVLATKYTVSRDRADPNGAGNSRKNLRLSLESSLRRLGTDHVDLYYVHVWDPATPLEETMRALDDAVRAGKILYVGISDTPAWVLARANTLAEWRGWTPFCALQVPYNLLRRDAERELIPAAQALGLSVAAWGPLARGVLSGKHIRPSGGPQVPTRVSAASLSDRDRAVAAAVARVADRLDVSSSQVAIAWTRARSRAVHPIVGVSNLAQLQDNLGALDVTLAADALEELESAASFEVGFPSDFIARFSGFVYGDAGALVDRGAP